MSTKIKKSALIQNIRNQFGGFRNQAGQVPISQPQSTLPAFSKRMPVTRFLIDTFFPGYTPFETKHVLMDFYKNRQAIAPFVANNSGPINIRREGYRTNIYTAPFINISVPYDANFLETRLHGENVFDSGVTPAERALIHMQNDYNELEDRIVRSEEVMASQVLQTGSATITGYVDDSATEVRTDTIDFDFENIINLQTPWGDDDDTEIYDDIEDAANLVRQGGYNPEIVILGQNAARKFVKNKKILRMLDIKNANFGEINPLLRLMNGNGYARIGFLAGIGVEVYQYVAWYFDEVSQTLKPYIEPDNVIIGARNIGEFLYGANTLIPEGSDNFVTVVGPRASKVTINRENDRKSLILKSRPVPKPNDVAAWAVINTAGE